EYPTERFWMDRGKLCSGGFIERDGMNGMDGRMPDVFGGTEPSNKKGIANKAHFSNACLAEDCRCSFKTKCALYSARFACNCAIVRSVSAINRLRRASRLYANSIL